MTSDKKSQTLRIVKAERSSGGKIVIALLVFTTTCALSLIIAGVTSLISLADRIHPIAGDAVFWTIVLTAAGADAIGSAAPGHAATVRRLIFDRLTEDERAAFERACAAIVDALTEQAS